MIDGKRILVVVPARGGSKGIPLKNLREVGGRPLVALAGDVASRAEGVDRQVVSTDHDEIARVAEQAGLAAPFRRSEDLSGDRIGDHAVLVEALTQMEKIDGVEYDVVVMLQPTSPLRTPDHVRECVEKCIHEGWDAVWTVSAADSKYHPLKQLKLSDAGGLDYYDPDGGAIIARQQLSQLYVRNGIAYAITRQCLLDQETIKGGRTAGLVIQGHHVSIDTEDDLAVVNQWMRSRED